VHRLHLRVIIAVDAEEVHHLGSRVGGVEVRVRGRVSPGVGVRVRVRTQVRVRVRVWV